MHEGSERAIERGGMRRVKREFPLAGLVLTSHFTAMNECRQKLCIALASYRQLMVAIHYMHGMMHPEEVDLSTSEPHIVGAAKTTMTMTMTTTMKGVKLLPGHN
jgi:hypothetical protein